MKKARQTNLEILRMISMLLIVMSHCDDIFGLYKIYNETLGANKLITDFLHMGGQVGVGCFILISGYFMVDQKITVSKILKIVGEVLFYTIVFFLIWMLINVCIGHIDITECLMEVMYAFLPILYSHYWFVTAYIILMVLSPFLNKLVNALDYKYYRRFLCIIVVVFVVILGGIPYGFRGMSEGRLIPIFILYFIAGYIKRFGKNERKKPTKCFSIAILTYFILLVVTYGITYVGIRFDDGLVMSIRYWYRTLNSPFIVIICIALFRGFLQLEIKNNKFINEIASCTFGVYLIHSNRLMIRILGKSFPIYKETRPGFVLLYSVIAIILIYTGCILIEFARKKTVGRLWVKFLDKCVNKSPQNEQQH